MADGTKIEWTDATWNPITGCSVVSPGCTNCYAMRLAGTRLRNHPSRAGLTRQSKAGPVWTGKVRLNRQELHKPAEWRRPRMIFVCAHGDLFAEEVPDEWILDVLTVIASNPHHHFQVLTKRAWRMREFMSRENLLEEIYANWSGFSGKPREVWSWPLHNLWLGVSTEDQKHARLRIPALLETPAAIRWISAEPLLGGLDLTNINGTTHESAEWAHNVLTGSFWRPGVGKPMTEPSDKRLHWVVAGGESGPGARPMHPDWARSLRDQCASAGVPFFFKQWGSWAPVPWKLVREPQESDARYIARSMSQCSQHAVSLGGHLAALDHQPWSVERTLPAPTSHQAVKRVNKATAGRLLDGIEYSAFPEVRHVG